MKIRIQKDAAFNANGAGSQAADGLCRMAQKGVSVPQISIRGRLYTGETLFESYGGAKMAQGYLEQVQAHYSTDIMTTMRSDHVMIHEIGHATDTYRIDAITQAKSEQLYGGPSNFDNLPSTYARENAKEAYAESFAQWTINRGVAVNPVVQQFAEYFGWRVPL
jgi:hypothetical protein